MLNESFKFKSLCKIDNQKTQTTNSNNNQALVSKYKPQIQSKQRIKITEDKWDKKKNKNKT